MVITKDYKILKKEELYYVISNEKQSCPFCRGQLFPIGSRKRSLILSDSTKISLVIKRYRCKDCQKIHHELPFCIVPYKRYELKVIEGIIKEHIETGNIKKQEAYPCEKSTVNHIMVWYQKLLLWVMILLEKGKIKIKYSYIKALCQNYFSEDWLGELLYELIKRNGKINFLRMYFFKKL